MSPNLEQFSLDYYRVEQAIAFIESNFQSQPTLKEVADAVHLSEFHFQKLFSRWVGISPKRFLQFLTKEYAKLLLKDAKNILDVTFETGLSGPGRLHDLFIQCEAVTPGEFKLQGHTVNIDYGFHPTPFGKCLLAVTSRGICHLAFVGESEQSELAKLKRKWTNATITENPEKTGKLAITIFKPGTKQRKTTLTLFLKGTNFQIKVWEALLKIPYGKVVAYEDIAQYIHRPKAVRAVANAVAANPVPFLVPCHRVIRKLGDFGGYQGGTCRKKAILAWEAAMSIEEHM